jgi:hypothetical protein
LQMAAPIPRVPPVTNATRGMKPSLSVSVVTAVLSRHDGRER